ncbi:MAG: alpha/beta fold hydrolase [Flavobacteriales bacterium]|nr:alpha/beta fold hydrolase [Flavobacteriales bacterium]
MSILLLHGALGSARQLKPLQERVGGVTIDLSGHGGREIPSDGIRFEHFLTDIDREFDEQNWKRAHLFGYSMGGYAALLYAAHHPDRVRSVITVGTKLAWTDEGLQKELRKLDPDMMLAKVPAFANALAVAHGEDRWRDVVTAIAKSMSDLAAAPMLTAEVVARIECPVLLCVGDGDTTAVPSDTQAFATGLRNAEVVVLPGTRHPFEEIDLTALVPLIERFWSQADQRPMSR